MTCTLSRFCSSGFLQSHRAVVLSRTNSLLCMRLTYRSCLHTQGSRPTVTRADKDAESHGHPGRSGVPLVGESNHLMLQEAVLQRREDGSNFKISFDVPRLGDVDTRDDFLGLRAAWPESMVSPGMRTAHSGKGGHAIWKTDFVTPAAAVGEITSRAHHSSGRRRLQGGDSCAFGASFDMSSSLYRAFNGCYSTVEGNSPYQFWSASYTSVILPMAVSSSITTSSFDYDTPHVWILAEVLFITTGSAVLLSTSCQSEGLFEEDSHPLDVTGWVCYMDGDYIPVTPESLGLSCGCDADGATTAPGVAPVTPAPADASSPEGDSGCGGTDSFTISSSLLEEFEGCYEDAGEAEMFFSMTGEKADGVMAVFPGSLDEQEADVRWIVGMYAEEGEDRLVTCVSDESPTTAHPADSTFTCDVTGTGAFITVTEDQVGFSCGCDSTPAPSASARSIGSVSPTITAPSEGVTLSPEDTDEIDALDTDGGGALAAPGLLSLVSGVSGLFVGLAGAIMATL